MLGVLPFGEDPDLSCTAGCAVPQYLPPWSAVQIEYQLLLIRARLITLNYIRM